jgi:hypothetical protein
MLVFNLKENVFFFGYFTGGLTLVKLKLAGVTFLVLTCKYTKTYYVF